MIELRVVQRGYEVTGYVNGHLAGSLTLHRPPMGRVVGIAFKARPGQVGRIRFSAFAVRSAD